MSQQDPQPITYNGHTPTVLEVIADYIVSVTPGAEINKDVFLSYNKDAPGIVRWITTLPGTTIETMGTAMAAELPVVQVNVRGDKAQYIAPRDELIRLRYKILAIRGYTSRGLTIQAVTAPGGIEELGRDLSDREGFRATFQAMVGPSYE